MGSQTIVIRNAIRNDFDAICALNRAEVQHTSVMEVARLEVLAGLACLFKVACVGDRVAAFIIAMRDGARYENENFSWFAQRYPAFLYVDRIVVAVECKGMRIGSLQAARAKGSATVLEPMRLAALRGILQYAQAACVTNDAPFLDFFDGAKATQTGRVVVQAAIAYAGRLHRRRGSIKRVGLHAAGI